MPPIKIVLIGAGNVGYHLAHQIHTSSLQLLQIFSRTHKKARSLAKSCATTYTTQLNRIDKTADLYILAVHDDAIAEVAAILALQLPKGKLVVHTSGSTPTTAIQQHIPTAGILYPLQTFSRDRTPDFQQIPICIHADAPQHLAFLKQVATHLSPKLYVINDEQRAILHVAAVFVNNFTNHLFHIGETICEQENLPFQLLKPLINETVAKIQQHKALDMQTGPAARGDLATLQRHLNYLQQQPELADLYQQLSQSINPKLRK